MKKNFKYAIMAAVLSMGMVSCSNNDDDAVDGIDTNQPAESAEAYATITLKNEAVTRAVANFGATDAEKVIHTVKVYVFNSLRVLEQIETFKDTEVADKKKTFKTSAGTHYFLAVANAPVVTIPLGTGMDFMSQLINNIDAAKFQGFIDPAGTPDKGFFMTSGVFTDNTNGARYYRSHDYAVADLIPVDVSDPNNIVIPAENKVSIPIGRAMAKVNLAILKTKEEIAGDEGTINISTAKYTLANNPDQTYYFPYFGTDQRFQTPTFDFYNTSVAPTNYWPALHGLVDADYSAIATSNAFDKDEKYMKPYYALENSNKLPTYGNATILSVQATFIPNDAAWEDTKVGEGENFYRIYNNVNKKFYTTGPNKGFWSNVGTATGLVTSLNAVPDGDVELVTYDKGVCYYIIPLKNKDRVAAPECYDVVRNHFFDVVITKITGCGYDVPGGNEETEEKDPLDPNTYMVEATIEVKSWIHVSQEEEIGLRP